MVAVAAVDAVRNRDDAAATAETTSELEGRDALTGQLTRLGARGELVLHGDGCRVEVLALPTLEQTQEPASGCRPHGAVSPDGSSVARCGGDAVEVFVHETGDHEYTIPGCAPAWRPDGTLTVAFGREVVRPRTCTGERFCPQTLISRSELERAARRHPNMPSGPFRVRALIDGIAWVSSTTAAVQLSIRGSGRLGGLGALSAIAFFEQGRLSREQSYFRVTGGRIAASPRGSYVSMAPDVILRRDGSQVTLPQHLRGSHAFAWSADERFLALATSFAVHVLDVPSLERYHVTGSDLRSVTLPLRVTELAWR